ncbi:hypothetical protein BJ875DRAFT_518291 [Amylocarpus encephaloides]|uniref:F-box domain-containing protein n=1 Tax=Amylocarpus encephaloides TaxID=45428 RepID=A0A9P7YC85_9HELO|nr:hypothetical protein BJ875DRAFT_518291 [Amylocarpus encephaloides]
MVYCCVCGLDIGGIQYPETFDLDDDEIAQLYDKEKLSGEQLEWTRGGFCLINEKSFGKVEHPETGNPSLTYFTIPEGEPIHIRTCNPTFESDGQFPDITSPESFFSIHLKCLSLIHHVVNRKLSLQSNGTIFSCGPIHHFYQLLDRIRPLIREDPEGVTGKGIEWNHGYYGARRFWFDGWTMERDWEYLCADPFDVPTLTEYVLSNLEQTPIQEAPQRAQVEHDYEAPLYNSHAALDSLPVEILDRIISNLPISSILHLNRTSQKLCNKIVLDQAFWRDQLLSVNLIPFIWDLDREACIQKEKTLPVNTCWDWRTLACKLLEEPFIELALKDRLAQPLANDLGRRHFEFWRDLSKVSMSKLEDHPPLGLINRVRIVRIIEEAILLAENEY